MQKVEFLTIYATFGNLNVVKKTLPSVLEETHRYGNAKLIVHDSTERTHGRDRKWRYLKSLEKKHNFFLLLSSNLSMAHARNMCLHVGQEMFAPDYIVMLEDDHGYKEGFIGVSVDAMKKYYGRYVPGSELRFGMFGGCGKHHIAKRTILNDGNAYPALDAKSGVLGGPDKMGAINSCCRIAPTSHWNNVLKGYDTDEYLISTFQTNGINRRNYHKGFNSMIIQNGDYMFDLEEGGRGCSDTGLRLWDEEYAASDGRSRFKGKG